MIKWSEGEKQYGPLTICRGAGRWDLAAIFYTNDDEQEPFNRLRFKLFGWVILLDLPVVVRPFPVKKKWTIPVPPERGTHYTIYIPREYGVDYTHDMNFVRIMYGRNGWRLGEPEHEKVFCFNLPFREWKFQDTKLLNPDGSEFATLAEWATLGSGYFEENERLKEALGYQTFEFADFDGEVIQAKTQKEQWVWTLGIGWFSWLRYISKPKISNTLDLKFSSEVGKRKGSWKGGTVGHSVQLLSADEPAESAFRRYCGEHNLTFIREVV